MVIEIITAIICIFFVLFIPGYLLSLLLFKDVDVFERVAISVVLSIFVDVFVGLFFGATKYNKMITGGITVFNIIAGLIVVSAAFCLIYYLKGKNAKIH